MDWEALREASCLARYDDCALRDDAGSILLATARDMQTARASSSRRASRKERAVRWRGER